MPVKFPRITLAFWLPMMRSTVAIGATTLVQQGILQNTFWSLATGRILSGMITSGCRFLLVFTLTYALTLRCDLGCFASNPIDGKDLAAEEKSPPCHHSENQSGQPPDRSRPSATCIHGQIVGETSNKLKKLTVVAFVFTPLAQSIATSPLITLLDERQVYQPEPPPLFGTPLNLRI